MTNRHRKNSVAVVIVAAGSGERMGQLDKAFSTLGAWPILAYAVDVFEHNDEVDSIVLVVRDQSMAKAHEMIAGLKCRKFKSMCTGGQYRTESVAAGLTHVNEADWVIVHDGVRPFVTHQMIKDGIRAAHATGAAIAGVPVKDTVKIVDESLHVLETPDRNRMWLAQTPQVFRRDLLERALSTLKERVTDEASAVERMDVAVKVYPGSYDNIKITTPDDVDLAHLILHRIGHRLVERA